MGKSALKYGRKTVKTIDDCLTVLWKFKKLKYGQKYVRKAVNNIGVWWHPSRSRAIKILSIKTKFSVMSHAYSAFKLGWLSTKTLCSSFFQIDISFYLCCLFKDSVTRSPLTKPCQIVLTQVLVRFTGRFYV